MSTFSDLPTNILRNIYLKAIALRNEDKKEEAARNIALEVVEHLKISCYTKTSHTFSVSLDKWSVLESPTGWTCLGWLYYRKCISPEDGGHTLFDINNIRGEYKIDYIPTGYLDEFGEIVMKHVMVEFNISCF
jgi:hypothetical protein